MHLKPVFGTQHPFVFEGRECLIDIVLSKKGVKCAVFKISDVQKIFYNISTNSLSFLQYGE